MKRKIVKRTEIIEEKNTFGATYFLGLEIDDNKCQVTGKNFSLSEPGA